MLSDYTFAYRYYTDIPYDEMSDLQKHVISHVDVITNHMLVHDGKVIDNRDSKYIDFKFKLGEEIYKAMIEDELNDEDIIYSIDVMIEIYLACIDFYYILEPIDMSTAYSLSFWLSKLSQYLTYNNLDNMDNDKPLELDTLINNKNFAEEFDVFVKENVQLV